MLEAAVEEKFAQQEKILEAEEKAGKPGTPDKRTALVRAVRLADITCKTS
jgi:hypothetical protein